MKSSRLQVSYPETTTVHDIPKHIIALPPAGGGRYELEMIFPVPPSRGYPSAESLQRHFTGAIAQYAWVEEPSGFPAEPPGYPSEPSWEPAPLKD